MNDRSWMSLRPDRARSLVDTRLQVHHAAQLASAFGISYAEPATDDSHTNLEWMDGALVSRPLLDIRIALRVSSLTLDVAGRSFSLPGRTTLTVTEWLRETLSTGGFDGARYSLERHFELPAHPVADGAPFDASEGDLEELSRWLANGALVLERLRAADPRASEVRCWPHHFDIATLITVRPGQTVGVGLEPGDGYYAEPYFYVNLHPRPHPDALVGLPLGSGGWWHTRDWIGAVLPGSSLTLDPRGQESQVADFIDRGIEAATALLG
jgi:hypothetical protein